ncbi:MAG: nuclear transport factor 2 family protein [Alphaproteobacteria bacterium]|jgi:hypothetical protein|tara:strand:+ start:599 stop:1063 length:465 start_codon:yes stop_codon:yes gene_type:complete
MMATLSLEDREAIYTILKRYLWCMDTTHIDGVVETFTPDGEVKDVTGKRWDAAAGGVRGFATHFLTLPDRPDAQHWVQHMFVENAGDGGAGDAWRVVSYWASLAWTPGSDEKFVRLLGSYRDTCVKVDSAWLIREKIIDPWSGTSVPAGGAFAL